LPNATAGELTPFHLNAANGFIDFALQLQVYERRQGGIYGEVGLGRPEWKMAIEASSIQS
jgi:hypothetical protein